MSNNRDATTVRGGVLRGILRVTLLLGLAGIALRMSGDAQGANRTLLLVLAGGLGAICVWGIVETTMELRRIRRRQ